MTELDLPQITIQRYLQLLKRRWWQVVPVTVFGLVAGAVAAFLIPRYYVAVTKCVFQGGGAFDPNAVDPLFARVSNAPRDIPALAERAIVAAKWDEAKDEDQKRRQEFIDAVKSRVLVQLPNDTLKAANKINIDIYYRDTDGPRSAELANWLREVWFEDVRDELEAKASSDLEAANRRVKVAEEAKRNAEIVLRNHMVEHGLLVDFDPNARGPRPRNPLAVERSEINLELSGVKRQRAQLESKIEILEEELRSGAIPQKRTVLADAVADPAIESKYQELVEAHATAKRRVEGSAPSNPSRRIYEAQLAAVETQLREVEAQRSSARTIEVDNEAYLQKREQLATWRAELEGLRNSERELAVQLADKDARLAALPAIESDRQQFQSLVTRLENELEAVAAQQRELADRYSALVRNNPFGTLERAEVPPRPTDPNIVLVALAGSLIGLAAAIGLILLLDLLQSAFKSVEDVERALPVPVLGALAYLETFEERTHAVSHRRRVSLAAGVFLFLSLSVVTIYFVDPTRLPPFVAEALDVILGAPTSAGNPTATPK